MSETVIRVENLSKKYRIQHQRERQRYTTLRDAVTDKLLSPWRRLSNPQSQISDSAATEDFWALRDVSFEIKQGEVVGIIGRNGAGKSTLLKILSRITEPTTGRVGIKGHIASLLEVGTGFHPELSGRENIYLNGAILGMTQADIKKKFDEIVAFAEIEKFLDTPVKRYSSGMYVRLAFAVAAHLDPDILIVDEVLAVGDAEFQKKCLGKMQQVSAGQGRTVLFVSHNLSAIRTLCNAGIVLNQGRVEFTGKIVDAVETYSNLTSQPLIIHTTKNDKPSILRVEVDEQQVCEGNFKLNVEFSSPWPLDPLLIGAVIYDQLGTPVFGFNTQMDDRFCPQPVTSGVATLEIPNLALHTGTYRVAIFLGEKSQNHDVVENAAIFNFIAPEALPAGVSAEFVGPMRVKGCWGIAASQ